MITINDVRQGTDAWHDLREGKYTGSNAAKLLQYGAVDASASHRSRFRGNYHTERGHILEDEAVGLYEQIKDTEVLRPGFVTTDNFPHAGYSPDFIAGDILGEVKCFGEEKHRRCIAGAIPLEVRAQVHFGMFVCGLQLAHLVFYNPDIEAEAAFKITEIRRNAKIERHFRELLTKGDI